MTETLNITRPDDWHLHLRDGEVLPTTVNHAAGQFARAIVMPNLKPPVTTTDQALAYRARIMAALDPGRDFAPLMTLYLTDNTTPDEIKRATGSGAVHACKLYPAGATTNSDAGVTDLARLDRVLEAMATANLPLLVHGEVTDPEVDIFDREAVFIERHLAPLLDRHPDLKVVFEHLTTADGVDFVASAGPRVAATITAHHLLYNRNAIFTGGINPHYYCLPVLKREKHREALVAAATGGSGKFFLGTDSAPHARDQKECGCGCAGIYTAHAALEFYALAFEKVGALDRLEAFAAWHGPDFYGLPRNTEKVTLVKEDWQVPDSYGFGYSEVVPLLGGATLGWRLKRFGE
jgi:dihydroorotase